MGTTLEKLKEAATDEWMKAWLDSRQNPYVFAVGVLNYLPYGAPNPNNKRQLEKWQDEFLRNFFLNANNEPTEDPRHSVRSGHGVGKAQPVSTAIDTPTGPRRFGDLKPGDVVFGKDGKPTRVVEVFPQGTRPVFKVSFNDRTSTRACGEHLWSVRGRQERRNGIKDFRVMSTKEILDAGVKRRNGGRAIARCMASQWEVPVCDPITYPHRWTPVDPYTLGAWLGDGTRLTNCITTEDRQVVEAIRDAGYTVTQRRKGALTDELAPYWCVHGMADGLRHAGVFEFGSHERFVPDAYKHNIAEVRAEVLRGLMDADGCITPTGTPIFTSSSKRLIGDVAWLVRSLGGIARVSSEKIKNQVTSEGERIPGRPSWGVSMCLPPGFRLFKIDRKQERMRDQTQVRYMARWIESIEPDGDEECTCIKVEASDSLYLTNDFIVTHNTTVIAILALWHPLTHFDAKCVISANSQDQLKVNNWAEIKKTASYLPQPLRDQIQIDEEMLYMKASPEMAFVVRRTASKANPEALAGIHAESVLYLVDEASGISEVIFETASGSFSTKGAMVAMFSNPTRRVGFFFDTHHKMRHRWRCARVSSKDVPRAQGHIEDIVAAYGLGSNKYRVRVEGEFPTKDDDVVIPLELVESAKKRQVEKRNVRGVWGLDIARYGDDSTALAKRQGNVLLEPVKEWNGLDTMQTVGKVVDEWERTPEEERPAEIMVDVIGIGSGVVDRLSELGLPVTGVNVAESASNDTKYHRLRDELWFKGREWFEARNCLIPDDEKLISELTIVTYDFHSDGSSVVSSKKELKKNGIPSPNKADAFLLTFATMDRQRELRQRRRHARARSAWAA